MSKSIYTLTRQIAAIISIILSISLVGQGLYIRSIMNIILLVEFILTSKLFEKKCNLITTSYIYIFIILFFVNSYMACYCTENTINYFNNLGIFGHWTKDYYDLYFKGVFIAYIVIILYLKFFVKTIVKKSNEIKIEKGEFFNMKIGCALAIFLYYCSGKTPDILIPVLSFSIISVIFENRPKSKIIDIALCILLCYLYRKILLARFMFVQIVFPIITIFLMLTKLNDKKIKMTKIWSMAILGIVVIGLYGTISEVRKLNLLSGGGIELMSVLKSFSNLRYFFIRQLYRLFIIWIKLGAYIIEHVQTYGYFHGLTYFKSVSSIFGFEYISLAKISAFYDGAVYAQPGLVAEGYANFGIIGISINLCAVFFLMEYFRNSFNKKSNITSLFFMTVPFSKIILDGGTINSAIVLIVICTIISILNLIRKRKA